MEPKIFGLLPTELELLVLEFTGSSLPIAARVSRHWRSLAIRIQGPSKKVDRLLLSSLCTPSLFYWGFRQGLPRGDETCKLLAYSGRCDLLRFLIKEGSPPGVVSSRMAALGGRVNVLELMRELNLPFDSSLSAFAALGGKVSVLEWLQGKEEPFCDTTAHYAALGGDLPTLEWLQTHAPSTPPLHLDSKCWAYAALRGHLPALQRFSEKGWFPSGPSKAEVFHYAVEGGFIPVLEWLWKKGFHPGPCCFDFARSITILNWLFGICKELPNPFGLAVNAAKQGNVEVLKWIKEQGFDYTHKDLVFEAAALNRNLEVLKWLREEFGVVWRKRLVQQLRLRGFYEIVDWLLLNGGEGLPENTPTIG